MKSAFSSGKQNGSGDRAFVFRTRRSVQRCSAEPGPTTTANGPRISGAPRRKRGALRCVRGTKGSGSVRPDHFEHVFRLDLEIVAAPPGAHDRAGQAGLVDAVLDHRLVDVDG